MINVLLVGDNPGDAFFIRKSLKQASLIKFRLVQVHKLEEALKRLVEESFDAILLDLSLPESQGLDTVLALEQIEEDFKQRTA